MKPGNMHLRIQDNKGTPIGTNGFLPTPVWLNDVEASRVEHIEVDYDDTGETIVLTVTLEES